MLHHGKETLFFLKSYSINGKILLLPSKSTIMKRLMTWISALLVLALLCGSCASSKSRAMRKAERQLEQQEKASSKQYEKAKTSHYKHQSKKTKRMMQKDRRRAERMRRRQRSNPFF